MVKKIEQTMTDQAVAAVDRILESNDLLGLEAAMVCETLRLKANRLDEINSELGTNAALCGTLIAQLTRAQGEISKQCEHNDTVKTALLDILMREHN